MYLFIACKCSLCMQFSIRGTLPGASIETMSHSLALAHSGLHRLFPPIGEVVCWPAFRPCYYRPAALDSHESVGPCESAAGIRGGGWQPAPVLSSVTPTHSRNGFRREGLCPGLYCRRRCRGHFENDRGAY